MTQKIKYSHLLFIMLTIGMLTGCKPKNSPTPSFQQNEIPKETLTDNQQPEVTKPEIIDSSVLKINDVIEEEEEEDQKNIPSITNEENTIDDKEPVTQQSNIIPIKNKQLKAKEKRQPQISFEELVWDFGEITEGDIIEKKFKFTNTGNAPLEIIATSATCGCTRPSFPFLEIAPGESNVIGVNYNSVGKEGVQEPEVTIESNTNPKTTIIKLYGIVKPKQKKGKNTSLVKDSTQQMH